MKRIILAFLVLMSIMAITDHLVAQETELSEKDTKKQAKAAAELDDFNEAKAMAESKRFVFVGSELYTAEGSVTLTSQTNFFYVVGDDATIQFTFQGMQYAPNPNGIGGVTAKGRVTKYEYKADKPKKPVTINVTVQPLAGQGSGIHQLAVTIYGEGNAELLMSSSGTRIKGTIVKPEDSKIYEGTQR